LESIGNTFSGNTGVIFYTLDNEVRETTAYSISSTRDKVSGSSDTFVVARFTSLLENQNLRSKFNSTSDFSRIAITLTQMSFTGFVGFDSLLIHCEDYLFADILIADTEDRATS